MLIIDNETLDITYLHLHPEEQVHIVINHDHMSVTTNEQCRRLWLAEGQQPLQKKENGQSIHILDFILETIERLSLTQT